VKRIHVVLAMAAWLGLSGMAHAASDTEVYCRRTDALVALAAGQPANYLVVGELCATKEELSNGTTLQLLVHGATYNHDYWDFGNLQGKTYSYARAVAASGMATLALDEIGVGGSSHPLSSLITVEAAAYVAHQIVGVLRDGTLTGTRFGKIIAVGHSLGSAVVWNEAIRYADVDGVIVTGAAHSRAQSFDAETRGSFQSAANDPRFATTGLDAGYLTTVAGTRARLFSAPLVSGEESHKDVVPATELKTAVALTTGMATRAIRVPVLSIVGSRDATTCGRNTHGGYFDCSSAAAVARHEAPYYSREARLHACAIPGAGHDLNLALNHDLEVTDVVVWSATFVDRSLAPRVDQVAVKRVRGVDATSQDRLPWNCAGVPPQSLRAGFP
jgi:pimeloyl-ACP methyl ester carboxylesterase